MTSHGKRVRNEDCGHEEEVLLVATAPRRPRTAPTAVFNACLCTVRALGAASQFLKELVRSSEVTRRLTPGQLPSLITMALLRDCPVYFKLDQAQVRIGTIDVTTTQHTIVARLDFDSRCGFLTLHATTHPSPVFFTLDDLPVQGENETVEWFRPDPEGRLQYNQHALDFAFANAFNDIPKTVFKHLHVPLTKTDNSGHPPKTELVHMPEVVRILRAQLQESQTMGPGEQGQRAGQGQKGAAEESEAEETFISVSPPSSAAGSCSSSAPPAPATASGTDLGRAMELLFERHTKVIVSMDVHFAIPNPGLVGVIRNSVGPLPPMLRPVAVECAITRCHLDEVQDMFPFLKGLGHKSYMIDVSDFWQCKRCSQASATRQIDSRMHVSLPALVATFQTSAGLRWARRSSGAGHGDHAYSTLDPLAVWGRNPLGVSFLKCMMIDCNHRLAQRSVKTCLLGCHRIQSWTLANTQGIMDPAYESRVDTMLLHNSASSHSVRDAIRFTESLCRKISQAISGFTTVATQEQLHKLVDGSKALYYYLIYCVHTVCHNVLGATNSPHFFARASESVKFDTSCAAKNPYALVKIDLDRPICEEKGPWLRYRNTHALIRSKSHHADRDARQALPSSGRITIVQTSPFAIRITKSHPVEGEGGASQAGGSVESAQHKQWMGRILAWRRAVWEREQEERAGAQQAGAVAEQAQQAEAPGGHVAGAPHDEALARLCAQMESVLNSALSSTCPVCDTKYKIVEGCTHVHCPKCGYHHCFACNKRFANARQARSVEDVEAVKREFQISSTNLYKSFAVTPLNRSVIKTMAVAEQTRDPEARQKVMATITHDMKERMVRMDGARYTHGIGRRYLNFGMCPLYLSDLAEVDLWEMEEDDAAEEMECPLYKSKSILKFIYTKHSTPLTTQQNPHYILGKMAINLLGEGFESYSREQETMMFGAGFLFRVAHMLYDFVIEQKMEPAGSTHENARKEAFAVMLHAGLEFYRASGKRLRVLPLDALTFMAYLQVAYIPKTAQDEHPDLEEPDLDYPPDTTPDLPLHQALLWTLIEMNCEWLKAGLCETAPDAARQHITYALIQSVVDEVGAQYPVFKTYDIFAPIKWPGEGQGRGANV